MFSENLKQARINKKMKQADVAEILGCAATSLTNWENGKVQPSMDVLSRICEIYEISPLALLDREYQFEDIVAISKKPVPERTYEEQIAMTFSAKVLQRMMTVEAQKAEKQMVEQIVDFFRKTGLHEMFGTLSRTQVNELKAEYEVNGGADHEILFAFHALTAENKRAFLSMLLGLLSDNDNLHNFGQNMDKAVSFSQERLVKQRKNIK